MLRHRALLMVTAFLVALTTCCTATTWDVAADWSITNGNPNGVWGYGYSPSTGGYLAYTLSALSDLGRAVWYGDSEASTGSMGWLKYSYPQEWGNSQYIEGHQAVMHPGSSGERAAIRWTSPVSALVTVHSAFSGQSISASGTTTDVHVLRNNVEVYSANLDGFAGRAVNNYLDAFGSSPVQVSDSQQVVGPGDTIDFLVGDGGNTWANDMTGIAATITTISVGPGSVSGTVTANAPGNPPIAGATVKVVGGSDQTTTASDGTYSMSLNAGIYTIEASHVWTGSRQETVTVTPNVTAAQSFSLTTRAGTTYYISPTGNDGGDGTSWATAWKNIGNGDAKGLLLPGDVVVVGAGTYTLTSSNGIGIALCSGQSFLPIRYQAAGSVVVSQNVSPTSSVLVYGFNVSASGIAIDGFEVTGGQYAVRLGSGTHDNSVSNCIIHGMRPGSTTANNSYGWCGGVYALSVTNSVFHHNVIYDIGNPSLDKAAAGFMLSGGQNIRIYHNTLASSWAGVHLWSNSGTTGASPVVNNIIIGMRSCGIDGGSRSGSLANTDNLYWNNLTNYGACATQGAGEFDANPQLDAAYRLAGGSPAIDAGTDLGYWFSGNSPDLGAYEFATRIAATRLGALRTVADGTFAEVTEPKVVTVGSEAFADGSYYIEDADRVSGIRVVQSLGAYPLSVGDRVTLDGVLGTAPSGERTLTMTSLVKTSHGTELTALGVNGRALTASIGLDPTGLLVRTCGKVTARASDKSYFYVSDGANPGVRVMASHLVTTLTGVPPVGRQVIVTGLAGRQMDETQSIRVIQPRGQDDLVVLPDTTSEMTKRDNWLLDNMGPDSPQYPFSFVYNGDQSAALLPSWTRHYSETALDEDRTLRTITYTDQATGLQVRCEAIVYGDFPTIEWKMFFKNTGLANTPIIENILPLDIAMNRGGDAEFILHRNQGTPCTASDYRPFDTILAPGTSTSVGAAGGRPMNTDMPYFNLEWDNQGMIIVIAWTGQWFSQWARDSGDSLKLVAGQEQTHFRLYPGEEVRTPLVVLQFWNADPSLSESMSTVSAQNTWRRWMLKHSVPRPGGEPFPPMLSAAACDFFPGLMSSIWDEIAILDGCVREGLSFDIWWRDAGWYPCGDGWWNTGTWEPDPARYPNGLAELSDRAHSYGLKQTVWFEPERVTGGSWLAVNHPEWLLGGTLLDLGNPDAWNWLVNHIDDLLTTEHIDMYRQDFNMDPLDYWRGNDTSDRQGITEIKHVEGLYAYWDELKRRHPDMPFDNCASGGRRNDLEMMRRGVPLSKTDYAGGTTSSQSQFYGIASWLPYFAAGTGSYDLYTMRSNIAPWSASAWDTRNTGNNYALVRNYIAECRTVMPYYWGDYYPLTPYSLDSDVWMAWQFNLPESGTGLVQAFRRESSAISSATYKLHGLEPDATYTITDFDSTQTRKASGQQLMETGLTLSISQRPWAAIITYRKTGS